MRVLFVVPYVPSLVRVRPYQLIRHLSTRGHDVTVATVWTNRREQSEAEALGQHCKNVRAVYLSRRRSLLNCIRALATREPLQAHYSWSSGLMTEIIDLASRMDVVHVEHMRGALYALAVRRRGDAPVVWDSVDCISALFQQALHGRRDFIGRAITWLELSRTRRFESTLIQQFDHTIVSSALDRSALLAQTAAVQAHRHQIPPRGGSSADRISELHLADVSVLPNGVDLRYFTPGEAGRDADTIVFSGKMSYHANESAVTHLVQVVMPYVWSRRPTTRVVVVGKDPSKRLRRLLAPVRSRVTITGTVEDIRPYLTRATVAAVPLVYGAGCQNKVLEAMACGTPVVATPQAVSALRAEPDRHVLVAQTGEAFANALLRLLENAELRRVIGRAGREYVERYHRWEAVAEQLEVIYRDASIGHRRSSAPAVSST